MALAMRRPDGMHEKRYNKCQRGRFRIDAAHSPVSLWTCTLVPSLLTSFTFALSWGDGGADPLITLEEEWCGRLYSFQGRRKARSGAN
jgi:hypothetical protein